MPRIAATLGTFLLIAASIGFNIWRYPVVWEMAGRSADSERSQPEHTPQAASSAESATVPQPTDSQRASSIWQSAPITLPDSDPATPADQAPTPSADATAASPWQTIDRYATEQDPFKEASTATTSPSAASGSTVAASPPTEAPWGTTNTTYSPTPIDNSRGPTSIAPAGRYAIDAKTTEYGDSQDAIAEKPMVPVVGFPKPSEANSDLILDERLHRLPPVESGDTQVAELGASRLPDEPIPIYPNTGVE